MKTFLLRLLRPFLMATADRLAEEAACVADRAIKHAAEQINTALDKRKQADEHSAAAQKAHDLAKGVKALLA